MLSEETKIVAVRRVVRSGECFEYSHFLIVGDSGNSIIAYFMLFRASG